MVSSPYVDPVTTDPGAVRVENLDDYAAGRLRNTPFEHRPAISVYSSVLRFGGWLGRQGVTANALTLGSLLLAAFAGGAVAFGYFITGAVLVVLSGLLDALDGAVARATGRESAFGALLDSTVDRLADSLPLLGIAAFYAPHGRVALLPMVALVLAFLVSYIRARAEGLGVKLPPLFMRRAERVVLLTFTLLLAPVSVPGISIPAPMMLLGVTVIGVLCGVGAWLALGSARDVLERTSRPTQSISEPSE